MKDVLTSEERDSLTIYGEVINAQFRNDGQMALHIREGAPRDVDGVALVSPGDVEKLAALFDEMRRRGEGL